ncbi:hypothetical protein D3C84_1205990 [compost metagenome]
MDVWDPIGLLEGGQHDDEYEGEAKSVAIYIIKHMDDMSVAGLGQAIGRIFKRAFLDEFQSGEETFEIAIRILRDLTSGEEDEA